jgi:nitrite reductase/ring-hydroxylating ferredoxin subunit
MPRPHPPEPLTLSAIGGPPAGTELCRLSDLGGRPALTLACGEGHVQREVFLMAHGGGVVAYLNDCPHRHLPLNFHPDRFLDPEGQHILCTNHIAHFRIEDGYCLEGPCPGQWLTPVAVRVEGDRVLAG